MPGLTDAQTRSDLEALVIQLSKVEPGLEEERQIASQISAFGADAIEPVLQAARDDSVQWTQVREVFRNLQGDDARRGLRELLLDPDDRAACAAASVLAGDSESAESLQNLLVRVQEDSIRTEVASYLWSARPDESSANVILEAARQNPNARMDLLAMLPPEWQQQKLTVHERLEFLLERSMPDGAKALSVSLDSETSLNELFQSEEIRKFIDNHPKEVVQFMSYRLRETGSCAAALVLGYFRDKRSLPELQRWFLEQDYMHEYESSLPRDLDSSRYPYHHCYEEAIRRISGKPIEEVIQLNLAQTNQLIAKYHQNITAGLYVLKRLQPESAASEVFRSFRQGSRNLNVCMNALEFLEVGVDQTRVEEALGKPERSREKSWIYECGEDPAVEGREIFLQFDFQGGQLDRRHILRQ